MTSNPMIPSRKTFVEAVSYNQQHRHENLGFLSEKWGFLPSTPPLRSFPESHRVWDEIIPRLPALFQSMDMRTVLDQMPLLPADEANLSDEYLCRASTVIGILAHCYARVTVHAPDALPDCIQLPWETIARRLKRPAAFLSYIDLIMYNWRLRDPTLPDPLLIENMDLLVPTVANEEERIFYLAQVEIAARCAPVVMATVRAQEAAVKGDRNALELEMLLIMDCLQGAANIAFQKISPNPHSETYVDPVVWAKTVAPFAVPVQPGLPGPSGTAAPLFHLMDAFLARPQFNAVLGKEAVHLAQQSPPHWQNFIAAVRQTSIRDFIALTHDSYLEGLFDGLLDAYAGDRGFLGRHRLKVYGYLEIAFKVGRSVTIGGFKGLFKDKTWDQIDHELSLSRDERYLGIPEHCHFVNVAGGEITHSEAGEWQAHVRLDISKSGIKYQPGDRVGVLPENSDRLIRLTLEALQATGNEQIRINRMWKAALFLRDGYETSGDYIPLADLLRFGRIRPLTRDTGKHLLTITGSGPLKRILNARMEDQWELWDMLNILYAGGYDTRRLWRAEPWEPESICRVVVPETFRLYSIATAPTIGPAGQETLHLNVSGLEYESVDSRFSIAEPRYGAGSNFLRQVTEAESVDKRVSMQIVPAPRFHLPTDPTSPIVMFAGGSGIAPFIGFLQERARQPNSGENWLIWSIRTPDQLIHRELLQQQYQAGKLQLKIAITRADRVAQMVETQEGSRLVFEDGPRSHIDALIEDSHTGAMLEDLLRSKEQGGQGAHLYVCGKTGFASVVMNSIKRVIQQHSDHTDGVQNSLALRRFYQMRAQGRYHEDIFTTYSGTASDSGLTYDASEVVRHNNAEDGYWIVVDGKVYDVTEFAQMHAGGNRIIISNAGIDATRTYQAVQHHTHTEVDAMLGMYQIGTIRRLNFEVEWGTSIGPNGLYFFTLETAFQTWARYLYMVTEMENALNNDWSVLHKSTTLGELPHVLTPLKIQFLTEAHKRFLYHYLDGLIGEDLQVLWSLTIGLGHKNESILWMEREMARIHQADAAQVVRSSPQMLWNLLNALTMVDQTTRRDIMARLGALVAVIREENEQVISEIKFAVREAVILFERYEADVATASGSTILQTVQGIPIVVEKYYHRLAERISAILATDTLRLDQYQKTENQLPIGLELPGHGTQIDLDDLTEPTDPFEA